MPPHNCVAHAALLQHRYYGNSWPFGKEESLTLEGLQFLSMEQVGRCLGG